MTPNESALIGIDWGMTRLRAFRIGADGRILDRRMNDHGIAQIGDADFDRVLREIIAGWPSGMPILMSGMIGSRQGWREVPYQPCPACVTDLTNGLCSIKTSYGPAWIVGGISTMTNQDKEGEGDARRIYDVMRGEETQIFGVASATADTLVITPGTHSKWAVVQAGTIRRFRTYMTGEIYAVLQKHSILGRLIQHDSGGKSDEAPFLDGFHLGLEEPSLLHSLFSVRTQGLFEQKTPAELAHYLSGILIGSEVSAEAASHDLDSTVIVIGSSDLTRLYQIALAERGFRSVLRRDGEDAVVQGLWKLWQLRAEIA
jgi:2-dehydro-3-deoxygalactonokinase